MKTVNQIIAEHAVFTDEQRSLAWSPMPPPERTGAHDCRVGGSCGLDFNGETRRSRWIQARFRYLKEARRKQVDSLLQFDPVHRPCRCVRCAHRRLLVLLRDLDAQYGPATEIELKKETVQ